MSSNNSAPGNVGAFSAILTNFDRSASRDISPLILEYNLHEDIFSPAILGNVTVADAQAFQALFPLVGDEQFQVDLASPNRDDQHLLSNFRIYKMENYGPAKDRATVYSLHAAGSPIVYDQTKIVTGAYGPATADKIVQGLFNTYLKPVVTTPLLTAEGCRGTHTFTYPKMSPLRAIALTASEAVSETFPDSVLAFYETHEGFHFRSLASLFKQVPAETYYWTTQNVQEDASHQYKMGSAAFFKHQIIISYVQHRAFDILRGLTNGQFGMTQQFLDPVMKVFGSRTYTYSDAFGASPHVGDTRDGTFPVLKSASRLLDGAEQAHSRYHVTSLPKGPSAFISNRLQAAKATDYPRHRTEHLAASYASLIQLQNTATFLVAVPGNSNLSAGHVVDLVLPVMTGNQRDATRGGFSRGHYLVTSLCHRYSSGVYTTVLECMRDSSAQPVVGARPGSVGSQVPVTTQPEDGVL
jgi:hypothetical protein